MMSRGRGRALTLVCALALGCTGAEGAGTPAAGGASGGSNSAVSGGSNGGAGTAGTAPAGGTPEQGGSAGVSSLAGSATAGGTAGQAGNGGSSGSPALTGTQAIMVLGSSNELITCWRAFLWQKLRAAQIQNFDFVGGVTDGPDCSVPGYDRDLQAKSGIIISTLPPSQYADWFNAHEPDIILMHFGGADILNNMPVDGVMKAYTTALEQARLVNPKVRLFIAQHTPQAADTCNDCDANVQALNAAIAQWAPEKTTVESPVVAVDLYTGLVTASDFSDGVHLNESGSQKVSDRFFAVLEPLFAP
jgi:lysophospholipase L1-like esterase